MLTDSDRKVIVVSTPHKKGDVQTLKSDRSMDLKTYAEQAKIEVIQTFLME